ncbi:MAG TPA: zf-HC2 domain-containing protein, partial [Kofleriaceae bacterium]
MIDPHGKAGAYFDGELDEAGNAAFLEHLASCASCQRDLDDAMQLAVREPGLRAVDDAPALSEPRSVTALETPARRRPRALWIAAPAALV